MRLLQLCQPLATIYAHASFPHVSVFVFYIYSSFNQQFFSTSVCIPLPNLYVFPCSVYYMSLALSICLSTPCVYINFLPIICSPAYL